MTLGSASSPSQRGCQCATGQDDLPGRRHADRQDGFFNLIRIYPAQAVGIAIMGNATNYPIDAIARLALARS